MHIATVATVTTGPPGALVQVFDQALEGGGAKNFNFQELAADLAQITFDYPFRIPPYFAIVIRAIGAASSILGAGCVSGDAC